MVIVFEGQPCKVVEFRHHTPGNLRAMIQTKLRNIRTGSSFEHRFRSVDTVERAAMEQHEMEYLYSDGSHHHFMNTETFDQVALSGDELGDAAQWLAPGLKIQAEFYEGAPIGICGLLKRDVLADVDIGYALLPEFWSKGYALESASAVMAYASEMLGLKRVVAVTNSDNKSSIRLLEKMGFYYERMVRLSEGAPEIKLFAADV